MTTLPLRPYQTECLTAVGDALKSGTNRSAVVLPTGSGKTVIFSHMASHWASASARVLILVHRDELITQTVNKLQAVAPDLPIGVVAGQTDGHAGARVVVGSVQTLRRLIRLDALRQSGPIGLIIVDECHHATAQSYQTIMSELGCPAVGFTATLTRSDRAPLGSVWAKVVYQRDILDMISDGYLVDVAGKLVTVDGLSLSTVAMSGGDYQIKSLSQALMSADAPAFAADAWQEHAAGRPGICFTPSVETAHAFTAEMMSRGIEARAVWGAMPTDERRSVLAQAHDGRVQVLVNCMVLTEGFDWPRAEVAMIARPTMSAGLYVQMVGRVLRPYPGKDSALVLDIVGASQEHRLATLADLSSRRINAVGELETLTMAACREREEANPFLRDYAVGVRDVDLFTASHAMWQRTYQGIWFVSTKERVFFVWPTDDPGLYNVGVKSLRKRGGKWLHQSVPLDLAMSWGEQEALKEDASVAGRTSSWRKKRQLPSLAQVKYAQSLGVSHEGMMRNELSCAIDVHIVSSLLDKPLMKER